MFSFLPKTIKKIVLGCFIILAFLGPIPSIIGQKLSYNVPSANAQDLSLSDDYNISCGFFTGSSLTGCLTHALYSLFYIPTSWGVTLSARMQDYFIFLSIKDSTYRSPIIEEGWRVLRDFANLIFIFGIIYVAVSFILGIGGDQKKQLANILIFATLINFSLFAGRLIVDFGNIFAFAIYEQINVVSVGSGSEDAVKAIGTGFLSITNPTKIMSAITNMPTDSLESTMNLLLIFGGLFNIAMISIFISVGFLFLKRIIGIYVYLIFSSMAFASKALPNADQILKDFSLRKWFNSLLQISISGGIYMLFVYLAINFLNSGLSLISSPQADNQLANLLLEFGISFALTFMFLQKGRDYLKSAMAEISKVVDGYATKVAGLALGLTAGAGMLAGKAALGGIQMIGKNKKLAEGLNSLSTGNSWVGKGLKKMGFANDGKTISERITEAAAEGKTGRSAFLARNMIRAGNKLDRTSFDIRQAPYLGAGINMLGKDFFGSEIDKKSFVPSWLQEGGSLSLSRIDQLKKKKQNLTKWAEEALLKDEMAKIHDNNAESENERQKKGQKRREEFDKKVDDFENEIIREAEESVGRVLTFEERNSMRLSEEERQLLHNDYLVNGKLNAVTNERFAKDANGNQIQDTKVGKKSFVIEDDKKGKITINAQTEQAYVKGKKEKEKEISKLVDEMEKRGEFDEKYKNATNSEDTINNISKDIATDIETQLTNIGQNLTVQQQNELQTKGTIDGISARNYYNYQKQAQDQATKDSTDLNKNVREAIIADLTALGMTPSLAEKSEIETTGEINGKDALTILNYNKKRRELEQEATNTRGNNNLTSAEKAELDQIMIDGTFKGQKIEDTDTVKNARKKVQEEQNKLEQIKNTNSYNGTDLDWHNDLMNNSGVRINSGKADAIKTAKLEEEESIRKTGQYKGEKIENSIESERIKDEQAEKLIKALTDLGTILNQADKDQIKNSRKYQGFSNNNYLNYLEKEKELGDKGIILTQKEKYSILNSNTLNGVKLSNLAEEAQRLGTVNGEDIKTLEEAFGFIEKKRELSAALNSKIINKYIKEKRGLKDREDFLGQVYAGITDWRDGLYFFKNEQGAGNSALLDLENKWGKGSENVQRVVEIRNTIKEMNERMFSLIEGTVNGLDKDLLVNATTGEKGDDFRKRFQKEASDVSNFHNATQELKEQSILIAQAEYEEKVLKMKKDLQNKIGKLSEIEERNYRLRIKQTEAQLETLKTTERKIKEYEKLAAEISQRYAIKD